MLIRLYPRYLRLGSVFLLFTKKRAGIRHCDLLRVYVSGIKHVPEYACSNVFIRPH